MAAGIGLSGNGEAGNGETIDLQQQVARMQALLEASRQVHATTCEEEVLEQVLSIVVRELEMAGAAFPEAGLVYGDAPDGEIDGSADRLAYPLEDRAGERMAELVVASPGGRALTIYEADFIEGLALQAAVALENARNHKRTIEFARVQQDIDAARDIQRSLLPQRLPEIAGYSLAFRSDTCYEVGGDYLDVVSQPDGSQLMVVADVAGKGMASAMMSTSFRSAFRAMAASGPPLADLAARMNQHHWAEGEEARRRYVTAIFLRLHPAFLPGTRLLFYTDGLTEVFKGDEEFGPERLLDAFLRCPSTLANDILDALWAAIQAFSEGGPQGDDMTALALVRASKPMEMEP